MRRSTAPADPPATHRTTFRSPQRSGLFGGNMTSEGSFARDQCLLRRGEIRELRIADFRVVQIERFEGLLWARRRRRSAGEFQTARLIAPTGVSGCASPPRSPAGFGGLRGQTGR
jgi:hypothetical protein